MIETQDIPRYLDRRTGNPATRLRLRQRMEQVLGAIREREADRRLRLLDLGAADGAMLSFLNSKLDLLEAAGIEPSVFAVSRNQDRKLDLVEGSAEDLPYGEGHFDVVVAASILEHVADEKKTLREACRVLKDGGLLVVAAVNPLWDKPATMVGLKKNDHLRVLSLSELKGEVEEAGFEVVSEKRFAFGIYHLVTARKVKKAMLVYLDPDDYEKELIFAGRRDYRVKRQPLLGFQYLSAALAAAGYGGEILDQTVSAPDFEGFLDDLASPRYVFLGLYSTSPLKEKVVGFIRNVRAAGSSIPIVVGGPGCRSGEDYLAAGADIVCHGEGEEAVVEIMDALNGKRERGSILGISFLKDGRVVKTVPRPVSEDIDQLPMPERKGALENYYDFHIFGMRTPYVMMMASRGCPYHCSYCASHGFWGSKVRVRGVDHVLAEIDHVVREHGVRYIRFRDDIFGYRQDWLEEFCDKLAARDYEVRWACTLHPFSLSKDTDRLLSKMKEAGCHFLLFGLESADPGVLKKARRDPRTPERLAPTLEAAKKHGMLTLLYFIIGLPGDDARSVETDISYALRVKPHYVRFSRLVQVEGSDLAREYEGRRPTAFSDQEIDALCSKAMRRFYTDPGVILQDAAYVLRQDPLWFFRAMKHAGYLMRGIGLRDG